MLTFMREQKDKGGLSPTAPPPPVHRHILPHIYTDDAPPPAPPALSLRILLTMCHVSCVCVFTLAHSPLLFLCVDRRTFGGPGAVESRPSPFSLRLSFCVHIYAVNLLPHSVTLWVSVHVPCVLSLFYCSPLHLFDSFFFYYLLCLYTLIRINSYLCNCIAHWPRCTTRPQAFHPRIYCLFVLLLSLARILFVVCSFSHLFSRPTTAASNVSYASSSSRMSQRSNQSQATNASRSSQVHALQEQLNHEKQEKEQLKRELENLREKLTEIASPSSSGRR